MKVQPPSPPPPDGRGFNAEAAEAAKGAEDHQRSLGPVKEKAMKTRMLVLSVLVALAALAGARRAWTAESQGTGILLRPVDVAEDALSKPDLPAGVAGQVVVCRLCHGRGFTTISHFRQVCRDCKAEGWLLQRDTGERTLLPLKPSAAALALIKEIKTEEAAREVSACEKYLTEAEKELANAQAALAAARANLAKLRGSPVPSPPPPVKASEPAAPAPGKPKPVMKVEILPAPPEEKPADQNGE